MSNTFPLSILIEWDYGNTKCELPCVAFHSIQWIQWYRRVPQTKKYAVERKTSFFPLYTETQNVENCLRMHEKLNSKSYVNIWCNDVILPVVTRFCGLQNDIQIILCALGVAHVRIRIHLNKKWNWANTW